MLTVNSITNGVVIDHIKAGLGYRIYQLLDLAKSPYSVALLMNVSSAKEGKKDILKIEQAGELDYSILSLLDPQITINEIKDEQVVNKYKVQLPNEVYDFIKCKNPRCISNHQNIKQHFHLMNPKTVIYRCHYCDNLDKCGGQEC